MKTETTDLLVIGAGPAGISAALYARRGGLAVTVVTKGIETGGLAKAEQIENYYGFAEPISGKELLRRGAAGGGSSMRHRNTSQSGKPGEWDR